MNKQIKRNLLSLALLTFPLSARAEDPNPDTTILIALLAQNATQQQAITALPNERLKNATIEIIDSLELANAAKSLFPAEITQGSLAKFIIDQASTLSPQSVAGNLGQKIVVQEQNNNVLYIIFNHNAEAITVEPRVFSNGLNEESVSFSSSQVLSSGEETIFAYPYNQDAKKFFQVEVEGPNATVREQTTLILVPQPDL